MLLGVDIERRKHIAFEPVKLRRRFRRELSVSGIGPKQMHSVLGYDHFYCRNSMPNVGYYLGVEVAKPRAANNIQEKLWEPKTLIPIDFRK